MNTFDLDTISNNLAHEAAAHHRTRLASNKVKQDMQQHAEAQTRRSLIADAHTLTAFTNTQATRTSKTLLQHGIISNDYTVQRLKQLSDKLVNDYGVSLLTMFAANNIHSVMRELAEFWRAEIENTNALVTALADKSVISKEDLPYFLVSLSDFPKGCRRRFFIRFAFLKHYGKEVNNSLWYNVAALQKQGCFLSVDNSANAE